MAFATNIVSKLRNLLQENYETVKDIFTFSSSRIFTLSEDKVGSIIAVLKNDNEVSESGNWSYSTTTNKLTFESGYSLTAGDTIEIQYTAYPNYSDSELQSFVKAAIVKISVLTYKTFEINDDDINPEPAEDEENLIAEVASIIIKPDNKSYRLPDLTITQPISSIGTDELIRKAVATFKRNTHGVFTVIDKRDII
jgi:hypothetical protein